LQSQRSKEFPWQIGRRRASAPSDGHIPQRKTAYFGAYEPPDPDEFDGLIDEGIKSEHFPLTDSVWEGIRQRGRHLAQQLKKGK
jgi:hypothetical protein